MLKSLRVYGQHWIKPASKSFGDSQDFGDVNMVLKWPIFTSPPGHNELRNQNPAEIPHVLNIIINAQQLAMFQAQKV